MTDLTARAEECVFSDDPEINRLCERRAVLLDFIYYSQTTPDEVLRELDDLNKKLEVFGL